MESDSVSISNTSINNGDNLIHNTNLDLEKGSLPCHKISESTTTINDFIPISTIRSTTIINDFIPLSTISTTNNDKKIPTGTPYHTFHNYNNIIDKDCGSRAKVEVDFMNEPGPLSDSRTINNSTDSVVQLIVARVQVMVLALRLVTAVTIRVPVRMSVQLINMTQAKIALGTIIILRANIALGTIIIIIRVIIIAIK